MRLLFEMDKKDYQPGGSVFRRPSVRGIIRRDENLAMVHSEKFGYYKFPGGGIEDGETHPETLIREAREETGLVVIPGSIREFGYVHRIEKGKYEDIFIQDNYYYFCSVEDRAVSQELSDYEQEEQFMLEWLTPEQAICRNRKALGNIPEEEAVFLKRELRVLELLLSADEEA